MADAPSRAPPRSTRGNPDRSAHHRSNSECPGRAVDRHFRERTAKMVDTMIAEDAAVLARTGTHSSLLLVSDDDDFVPVVLSLSRTTASTIRWVRQRSVG